MDLVCLKTELVCFGLILNVSTYKFCFFTGMGAMAEVPTIVAEVDQMLRKLMDNQVTS